MYRTNVYNPNKTNVLDVLSLKKTVNDMKENKRHHYRIVDPVRFFLAVVISIMILIFAGYSVIGAARVQAAAIRTYTQVTIQEGDNLWNLVKMYNPDSHIDIRDAIYDVYEINDIDESDIRPGEKIFIPIY